MAKADIRTELMQAFESLNAEQKKQAVQYVKQLAVRNELSRKARAKIDLSLVYSVVEARGFTRSESVPSLTDLLVAKIEKYHARKY